MEVASLVDMRAAMAKEEAMAKVAPMVEAMAKVAPMVEATVETVVMAAVEGAADHRKAHQVERMVAVALGEGSRSPLGIRSLRSSSSPGSIRSQRIPRHFCTLSVG